MVVTAALLLQLFVFELVNISGEWMLPTLKDGPVIIIYKVNYTPSRGDIVVFDSLDGIELVKRVIGLPDETIEIIKGNVYINGEMIEDEYQLPMAGSIASNKDTKG